MVTSQRAGRVISQLPAEIKSVTTLALASIFFILIFKADNLFKPRHSYFFMTKRGKINQGLEKEKIFFLCNA